jgi:hypothetical protein
MSSAQSGPVSNVQDSGVHGASPIEDVRLPYTQQPPSNPNLAKYPPQHSERGVPPTTHVINLNHDPEQARFRMPPNFSESSINLSKPKPDQDPADIRTSKVRGFFWMMMIH